MNLFFTLPIITFLAIFLINKKNLIRENLLITSLAWAFFIFLTTEVLSLFNAINCESIAAAWGLALISALVALKNRLITIELPKINKLFYVILIVCALTFLTGIVYPPNNWDSMTYHLPKIEHWIQNGNIAHYPTSSARQNVLAPFAEFIILHFRILSGNDYLSNSVQWLAFLLCISNVSLIAKYLGASDKAQVLAAFFCSTIPMAILQASSTQTDLVTAAWLTCVAAVTLRWINAQTWQNACAFGLSLGLACATKGTAYPIALPFVCVFSYYTFKRYTNQKFMYAIIAATITIILIVPHFIRTYHSTGDFLGGRAIRNTAITPSARSITANLLCQIATHLEPKLPYRMWHEPFTKCINSISQKILGPENKFPYGGFIKSPNFSLHEDAAQNTLHLILIFFTIFLLYINRKSLNKKIFIYLTTCVLSFFVFSSCIAWQPWISRLQTPLFILFCPIMAIILNHNNKKYIKYILILATISAISTAILNQSRPFIELSKWDMAFPKFSREQDYFRNKGKDFYTDYKNAVEGLCLKHKIGLIIGGDSWEYPLWAMLQQRGCKNIIFHITDKKDISNADALFIVDVKEKFEISRPDNLNPSILPR